MRCSISEIRLLPGNIATPAIRKDQTLRHKNFRQVYTTMSQTGRSFSRARPYTIRLIAESLVIRTGSYGACASVDFTAPLILSTTTLAAGSGAWAGRWTNWPELPDVVFSLIRGLASR